MNVEQEDWCGLEPKTLELWKMIVKLVGLQMIANNVGSVTIDRVDGENVRFIMDPLPKAKGGEG